MSDVPIAYASYVDLSAPQTEGLPDEAPGNLYQQCSSSKIII